MAHSSIDSSGMKRYCSNMRNLFRKLKLLKKQYNRPVVAFAVAVSLLILGAGLCIGVVGGELALSADCGAMANTTTFCPMQLAKMLADGQQLLSTMLHSEELMLLSILTVVATALTFLIVPPLHSSEPDRSRQKLFRWRNSVLKLFDYLLDAYARGILAPKLYA